jgi:hypothetical protein
MANHIKLTIQLRLKFKIAKFSLKIKTFKNNNIKINTIQGKNTTTQIKLMKLISKD